MHSIGPEIADRQSMADQETKSKPARASWIVWVLLCGLLTLGITAWLLTSRGTDSPAQANNVSAIASTFHLETFVLNLGGIDQRAYLRVGIDLGLNEDAKRAEETVPVAQVRDVILAVLGEAQADELLTATGKAKLKQDLLHALQQRIPQLGVQDVYFTEFLVQR